MDKDRIRESNERIGRLKLSGAHILSGKKGREAYSKLKPKLLENTPLNLHHIFDRPIYVSESIMGVGTTAYKDGIEIVVINENSARLRYVNPPCPLVKCKIPNRQDTFDNTVAHEFGHIIYHELLNPEIAKKYAGHYDWFGDNTFVEAFAFFFGDRISGYINNVRIMFPGYTEGDCPPCHRTHLRQMYFHLHRQTKSKSIKDIVMGLEDIFGQFMEENNRKFWEKYNSNKS
ncbi:hypothetical protein FJZ18_02195 [Candidatus Pacearchaeota archaeon]|nr:hypothetical protein [Candidatus Pacearchaeota archaeon]